MSIVKQYEATKTSIVGDAAGNVLSEIKYGEPLDKMAVWSTEPSKAMRFTKAEAVAFAGMVGGSAIELA